MSEGNPIFPWYDSYWLYSYVVCKNYILKNHSHRYQEFVDAFEQFRVDSSFTSMELNDLFSATELQVMKDHIAQLQQTSFEKYEFFDFGRIIKHDDPVFVTFQEKILDRVSVCVGEALEISYNFLSLYNNMGVLTPHMDACSAKWTLDFCIDQSDVWPIYLSKVVPWPEDFTPSDHWMEDIKQHPENDFKRYELTPGKALLFAGSSQWHYRERIANGSKNNFCHLIFFHFIPKGSRDLSYTKKWAKFFGIPELDELIIQE